MSKLATLRDARFDAGARYAAALTEFRAAYIDLAATDLALSNGNVGGGPVASFPNVPIDLNLLRHPDFAPDVANERAGTWNDATHRALEDKLR